MTEDERRPELSDLMSEVNDRVHELGERLEGPLVEGDEWAFVCECGEGGCTERVSLPLADYEELRRRGEPVLAPGHRLSRPQRVRRESRERVEEAKAVRAQAEQQTGRARGNLARAAERLDEAGQERRRDARRR